MSRTPSEISEKLLAKVVDALIPGDGTFPCASAVGIHRTVAIRAHEAAGPNFATPLAGAFEGEWQTLDDEAVCARLSAMEQAFPDEFAALLTAAYIAYYESFEVRNVLRALGFTYNDRPQPSGYDLAAFDPANKLENPPHQRGHFVETDKVAPVEFAHLGNLLERVG